VNLSEYGILVRTIDSYHLQQVKPEIFNLVRVEVDDVKVLSHTDDHLIEGHRTFWVFLYKLRG